MGKHAAQYRITDAEIAAVDNHERYLAQKVAAPLTRDRKLPLPETAYISWLKAPSWDEVMRGFA